MPCYCVDSADNFCYICGGDVSKEKKGHHRDSEKGVSSVFRTQDRRPRKVLCPHICCRKCAIFLSQWLNGKSHAMPFAVPVLWREPNNHTTDCHFCMVPPVSGGITKKKKWTIVYPNIPSVQFRTAKEFPFPNLRKNLPSNQTTRKKASRSRVLPSRRRLLNHTSPTVGLLRHSHTFSHRTNWTISFTIWSCPRSKQSYWDQDLNNGIFSRKMSEFLRSAVVFSSWCLSSETKMTLCSVTM